MDERSWAELRDAFNNALDEPGKQTQVLSSGGETPPNAEVEQLLRHLAEAERFLSVDDETQYGLLPPGTLLSGRYKVLAHLGSGGMGDVYEVEDEHLGETVALKILRLQVAQSRLALEQLRREVRHARRIVHPNVCREFDLGLDQDSRPYLTMERVYGEPLSSRLKRQGAVGQQEALLLAHQLCEGIAAAHDQQIVHGDLKPHNILLGGPPLRLVILDFGLSRYAPAIDGSAGTFSRVAAGTPAYLAPERYEGSPASYASDVYSLGVILHEIITGNLPLPGRNKLGEKIVAPAVPARWAKAIVACLCLNPAERPASARDVLAMLQPTPAGSRSKVAIRWGAVAAVLSLVVGAAAYLRVSRHSHANGSEATHRTLTDGLSPQPNDYVAAGSLYLDRQTPKSIDAAIQSFQAGLALDPNNARVNARLSRAFTRKYELTRDADWLKQAETALHRAEQVSPTSPEVLLARGTLERNRGDLRAAVADLDKSVEFDRGNPEAWRQLGRTYNQMGNILEAETAYEQGLQLNPSSWMLHCELGWFYYAHNQYGRAETELLRAEALAPDSSLVLANLGGVYLATGRLEEARKALVNAGELEPSANVAANLGSVYLKLNRRADAIAEYRKACDLSPNDYRMWINLAVALGQDNQEKAEADAYARATSLMTASLQVSPHNPHLLIEEALYLAIQKRSTEAASSEAQALALSPADPAILLQAAGVEARLGHRPEAGALVEKARDLGASSQQIQAILDAHLLGK